MFLKQLELENIRCFSKIILDADLAGGDNRKWTVILGENGTGKSTILKSIALVMLGSEGITDHLGEPDDWISSGQSQGTIRLKFETKSAKERQVELKFIRGESRRQFANRARKSLMRLDEALEHTSRSYLTIAYGTSRRLGSTGISRETNSSRLFFPRSRSSATLFDRNAELNPLENWAMELDYSSSGQKLGIVSEVLSDFLPEMTFSHIDKERKALIFDTPDGPVPLKQLSDGFQNVAAWVGDLLYQITDIFDDYSNPLNARGLLIIDEVDLHLHPNWQRRLINFLETRLPEFQMVVTTHSVVTAQQTRPGALHYCVRRKQGVDLEVFSGDPRKMLLNQLISTEAFGNISDESLAIEQDKEALRKIHRKKIKNQQDKEKILELGNRIEGLSVDAENLYFNKAQIDILDRLKSRIKD